MKNKVIFFNNAIAWIYNYTINDSGIAVTSKKSKIYPEVTGYYIPTLLNWGLKQKAISFATYLCKIQKPDGSWNDSDDCNPYVFDTAQILKGLLSIRNILPSVDHNIRKGADWILSNMQTNGRLTTPSKDSWGDDESFCSELIHLYCLSPLKEAGTIFGNKFYSDSADKILTYYKKNYYNKIKTFSLLSHFYAYVMEALYDLGEIVLCRESMINLEHYRNRKGAIPGLNNVSWVCSTGLFQLALVWYKLGELERGDTLFYYALSLQNNSGGWYGSYPERKILSLLNLRKHRPTYFSNQEISWAVKYFLDALSLKMKLEFDKQAPIFNDYIDSNDGRCKLIIKYASTFTNKNGKILEVGCGKGRYLKILKRNLPNLSLYASDLSENVMKEIDFVNEKKICSLTNLLFEDNSFDIVYACESLEHALNIKGAVSEMFRITKKGGSIIIIDKPIEKMGALEVGEWEQWISDSTIANITKELNGHLDIIKSVPYEGRDDGLFRAWIITK